MPGEFQTGSERVTAHQREHPHPFGEDDDLASGIVQQVGQQAFELVHLGAFVGLVVENVRGVAHHPHAGEVALELLEFLLAQRPPPGNGRQAPDQALVVVVEARLRVGHGHEEGLVHPARELALHVFLAPPQHDRGDAIRQRFQVPVADGTPLLVQVVELPVEAEQGAEEFRIQELHDGIDLVDPVFERRPGQDERVPAAELLDRVRGLGLPVLDALGFVENDHVGLQRGDQGIAVSQNLLVVAEGEERPAFVGGAARGRTAEHRGDGVLEALGSGAFGTGAFGARAFRGHARGTPSRMEELRDLLLPFRLQRCRRHHQHPLDAVQRTQQGAGGDGLRGLAEPHVVGKQRPFAEREVQHALGLVRQERALEQAVQRPAAGREIRLETGAGALPSHRRLPGFQPVFQAAGNAEAILAGTRRVPQRP